MSEEKELFLKTGLSQIAITNMLVEKLKPSMDYLTYNIKRYHVPVTLVLFYSEEDVFEQLTAAKRLTDAISTIKVGDSYFNFIFLPFTDEVDAYPFIRHVQYNELSNIKNLYYYEKLPPTIYNHYNFINTYLFEIAQLKETAN